MKKWHADEVGSGIEHEYEVYVYLASDVDARIAQLEQALRSIANSTCCEGCQEAKRVAISVL